MTEESSREAVPPPKAAVTVTVEASPDDPISTLHALLDDLKKTGHTILHITTGYHYV